MTAPHEPGAPRAKRRAAALLRARLHAARRSRCSKVARASICTCARSRARSRSGTPTRSRRCPRRPARSGSSSTAARRPRAFRSSSIRSRASSRSGSSGSRRNACSSSSTTARPAAHPVRDPRARAHDRRAPRPRDRAYRAQRVPGLEAAQAASACAAKLRGRLDATAIARVLRASSARSSGRGAASGARCCRERIEPEDRTGARFPPRALPRSSARRARSRRSRARAACR